MIGLKIKSIGYLIDFNVMFALEKLHFYWNRHFFWCHKILHSTNVCKYNSQWIKDEANLVVKTWIKFIKQYLKITKCIKIYAISNIWHPKIWFKTIFLTNSHNFVRLVIIFTRFELLSSETLRARSKQLTESANQNNVFEGISQDFNNFSKICKKV